MAKITYNAKTTEVSGGQQAALDTANKRFTSNIIIESDADTFEGTPSINTTYYGDWD